MNRLYLLLVVVLYASSCGKPATSAPAPNDPLVESPGPAVQLTRYPLTLGNTWIYDNGDTVRVIADTVIGGTSAKKVTTTNNATVQTSYYSNQPEGLYLLGTDARPYGLVGPTGFVTIGMVFFATPMLIVKYPVVINEQWSTHEPNVKYPLRNWVSFVSISNKAGIFSCAKLTGDATEYYSDKGLVRAVVQPECFTTPCPPLVTNLISVNF